MKYRLPGIVRCGVIESILPCELKVCAPSTPFVEVKWPDGLREMLMWFRYSSIQRVAVVVSCVTTHTFVRKFSHINTEWRRVGGWESPQLLLLLLSHLLSLSLTLEFATAFSKLQRWRSVIPSHPKRKLYDKKEVFNLPFMVTFTVKVLICIDMFLKCCAKLKLNTWVKPSGFKDPAKGQRDENQPAERSVILLFYATWLMQKWDLLAHSFHMRPTPSAEDFIYLCIRENQQKNGRKHLLGLCWLMKSHSYTPVPLPTFLAAWLL